MKYTTVLLDIDGTLLDFKKSQKKAFFRCFPNADEKLYEIYEEINLAQWARLEKGDATRSEILYTRFSLFFEKVGLRLDPDEMNERYLRYLSEGCDAMENAVETVKRLSRKAKTAAVTNGVALVQKKRLADSGLLPCFDAVLISEEVGFAKPDPRFFMLAAEKCGENDPGRVLMIGDSLTADIAGAERAGIDSCWFNPDKLPLPEGYSPTYITGQISDFLKIAEFGKI